MEPVEERLERIEKGIDKINRKMNDLITLVQRQLEVNAPDRKEIWANGVNLTALPQAQRSPAYYAIALFRCLFPTKEERIKYIIDPGKASPDRIPLSTTKGSPYYNELAEKIYGYFFSFI